MSNNSILLQLTLEGMEVLVNPRMVSLPSNFFGNSIKMLTKYVSGNTEKRVWVH